MPRYSNSNAVDTHLGWLRIPAGSFIDTESVFATLPAGVTKTLLTPDSNPIITSQLVSGNSGATTYAIPDTYNNYTIRIFCKAGQIAVNLNDASLTPAIILIAGEQFGFRVMNRVVGAVVITISTSTTTFKLDICKDSSTSWDIA